MKNFIITTLIGISTTIILFTILYLIALFITQPYYLIFTIIAIIILYGAGNTIIYFIAQNKKSIKDMRN